MKPGGEWISATEAGRLLQVHPQTVKAWAERGYLVAYQLHPHAHHLISLASVERMLADRQRALTRLQHSTADATAPSLDGAKIHANSDEEGESAITVGDQAPKHIGAFWPATTWLTAQTA